MESQEKNEPREGRAKGHRTARSRPGIDKTRSSRIVLVLRGLVSAARARIALRWLGCALGLMVLAAGCARRGTAQRPAPLSAPAPIGSTETGIASWYGVPYHGRPSASGEIFDMERLTAAHRALPFETWVEVTNLSNGNQVNVRITDRGPFVGGRIIDLSLAAARELDMVRAGTARVRLKVIHAPANAPPVNAPPVNTASTTVPRVTAPPSNALEIPATSATPYAVQVGAFADPSRAEALRVTLPYSDARVVERPGDPPLWRVLIGHALTIQTATALAAEVAKAVGEAIVVRDEPAVIEEGIKE
jgi:rare lipoprotein A